MVREDIYGNAPVISHTAYIDTSAILIGNIVIKDNVYIGPNVVIRADEVDENYRTGCIVISDGVSIQDGVNINTIGNSNIEIGKNVVVFNGAIIKGNCSIGNFSTLGIKSIVFNSNIDDGSYIGINSIVENAKIMNGMMVEHGAVINGDNVSKLLKPITKDINEMSQKIITNSINLVTGYKFMGM